MRNNRPFVLLTGAGCTVLCIALVAGIVALAAVLPFQSAFDQDRVPEEPEQVIVPTTTEVIRAQATQAVVPTLPARTAAEVLPGDAGEQAAIPPEEETALQVEPAQLAQLYQELIPGVVSIRVFVDQPAGLGGEGAGSGFIIDEQGYIVTNDHVVVDANTVSVVFFDGFEAAAEVVGTDDDSDLAVLRVDELPDNVHPLPIGNSDEVQPGQPVIAIGNPFGLGGSMTFGIVSAVGRVIPSIAPAVSGATFSIPSAIQTDAAINPGNSGGPLLNLQGQVIGVNAQIRTAGVAANSGVGFAIPSNVVRLVGPVLIEQGAYQWPWLGVQGDEVDLAIQEANDLPTQNGAYIHAVVPGGPAGQAGLQGSSGTESVLGRPVPVGGDIVIGFNGEEVNDFSELLSLTAFSSPGEEVVLTVWRNGETVELPVVLAARPETGQP